MIDIPYEDTHMCYDISIDNFIESKDSMESYTHYNYCIICQPYKRNVNTAIYVHLVFNDANRIEWELDPSMKDVIMNRITNHLPDMYSMNIVYHVWT